MSILPVSIIGDVHYRECVYYRKRLCGVSLKEVYMILLKGVCVYRRGLWGISHKDVYYKLFLY